MTISEKIEKAEEFVESWNNLEGDGVKDTAVREKVGRFTEEVLLEYTRLNESSVNDIVRSIIWNV
jgi:hypothetical protein